MESVNSTYKMPIAPGPPTFQAETLLFNDIMEEKSIALRNSMMSFLQVLPYSKFEIEFENFLKFTQNMALEGQRTGTNISRLTNSSQTSTFNRTPLTSFQYRQPTTAMSLMNNNRNSTFRAPENSSQLVKPYIPFDSTRSVSEPGVVISRIDQLRQTSNRSQTLATVVEVSYNGDKKRSINHDDKNVQLSERIPLPTQNEYSNVTTNKVMLTSSSQQNVNLNDDNNSVESLLESGGFKIIVGLPENYEAIKNNAILNQNVEMFLSKWSVNVKIKNLPQSKSKVVVVLTGTLLKDDKETVSENHHDAGILAARKDLTLVKTSNGLYRLIGNIIGGSPNELYQTCHAVRGVPRNWREIVKNNSRFFHKDTKNMSLNFTLNSLAGPIKPVKKSSVKPQNVSLNTSMTRSGKIYNKFTCTQKVEKRKSIDNGKSDKQRRKIQYLPLITSTPKRPRKHCMNDSLSGMLKNELHQKFYKDASVKLTGPLNLTNDLINVTENRRALKEQVQSSKLLKPTQEKANAKKKVHCSSSADGLFLKC